MTSANTKHTPGPWRIDDRGMYGISLGIDDEFGQNGGRNYNLATVMHGDPDELQANARLIASAPELLEALRITATNIRSLGPAGALSQVYEPYKPWLAAVEAAIVKATGEQQ